MTAKHAAGGCGDRDVQVSAFDSDGARQRKQFERLDHQRGGFGRSEPDVSPREAADPGQHESAPFRKNAYRALDLDAQVAAWWQPEGERMHAALRRSGG